MTRTGTRADERRMSMRPSRTTGWVQPHLRELLAEESARQSARGVEWGTRHADVRVADQVDRGLAQVGNQHAEYPVPIVVGVPALERREEARQNAFQSSSPGHTSGLSRCISFTRSKRGREPHVGCAHPSRLCLPYAEAIESKVTPDSIEHLRFTD